MGGGEIPARRRRVHRSVGQCRRDRIASFRPPSRPI